MKRSDLESFDPDTPLENLRRAREEMQRNFQQPMSARTMRVCTVCSVRWKTAEDGGGDYKRLVCCTKKRNIHTEDTTSHGEKIKEKEKQEEKKQEKKKQEKKKRCRVSNSRTLTG